MELNRLLVIAAIFMIVSQPMLSFSSLKCAKKMIDKYVNKSTILVQKMEKCPVPSLNGTIVIPLVDVVPKIWQKKNETVKEIEILSHLTMLSGAMAVVNVQAVPVCAKEPLEKLTKNIEDQRVIFKTIIKKKNGTLYPLLLDDSKGRNTSKILEIFTRYQKLMAGKIKKYLTENCTTTLRWQ